MFDFGTCPRCHNDISDERRQSNLVVCNHCGWILSSSEEFFRETSERNFIRVAIGASVIIVLGFIQLCTWDGHFLDVLPLQAKALVGMSAPADHEKMAEICLERKRFDCVEREYSRLGDIDPKLLLRLGKFQMSRAHYQEAANTYRNFFTKGGIDLEASYNFAKALGQTGQVDEAAKYYDYVLGAKPDVLQVTVIQNYVKLLMEAKRLDQAKKLIEGVRSKSEASAYFMDSEFKKIQELTGNKS